MEDENRKVHISETQQPANFDLEDILAEFGGGAESASEPEAESLEDRSKRLVLEQLPEGFDAVGFSSLDDVISDAVNEAEAPADDAEPAPEAWTDPDETNVWDAPAEADAPDSVGRDVHIAAPDDSAAPVWAGVPDGPPTAVPVGRDDPGAPSDDPAPADGSESSVGRGLAPGDEPADAPAPEPEPEPTDEEILEETLREYAAAEAVNDEDTAKADYAPAGDYITDAEGYVRPDDGEGPAHQADGRTAKERIAAPFVALMALLAVRRGKRADAAAAEETAAEATAKEQPEPTPEKALRAAQGQLSPQRFRGRIAIVMCLILIYLTYAASSALPLTGALGRSPRVLCLMMGILELTVCMAGLNVFTDGLVNLFTRKPDAKSLVAASCVLTALDAAVLAVLDDAAMGLPFCAAGAIGMTIAIWGEYWRCSALRRSYKVLTSSRSLYTVSGEQGITKEAALLKSRRSIRGFIRRSLEPDYSAGIFKVLTPMLLIAAVVLGALATLAHGNPKATLHGIAMCAAASAAFSSTLCFALPYAFAARRFGQSGAAVAGWPGIRDIGRSRNVIITDADVFPKGTLEMGDIRILEGSFVDKVISSTASVIAASGSGLAVPFAELLRRNGYSISRVENFEPHDGGGMTAMVDGESVAVGNTGFMNLIGVRVPQKLSTHNAVCTAMNGRLVGIFFVNYKATGGVQEALVTLLHSNLEPIFALRDFNITPKMLKDKFRLPGENFKFPSYSERFRISGAEPDKSSRVAAAIAREGMQPLVDAAERGRRLYSGIRVGTWITALGCVFGLLMMFLMCWTRTFDLSTAANVVTFMLLWLIPAAVIAWGVNR